VVSVAGGAARRVVDDRVAPVERPFADVERPLDDEAVLRLLAGARLDEVVRAPVLRRPDAPWREDPARPWGRGLRLVAVTVAPGYRPSATGPGTIGDRRSATPAPPHHPWQET
jgi:hypothetical protein